ncbi:MAG: hypothetical protein ACI3ZL_04610, partial [Candidatus Cryptobacteroides sp.]
YNRAPNCASRNTKPYNVSVLPHLLPDTDGRLSDEQKRNDFNNMLIGPPSVLLMDFLKGDKNIRRLCEKVRSLRSEDDRKNAVVRLLPHAIIPVKVWSRDFSFPPDKWVKSYNRLIALEFPAGDDRMRIVSVLKSKPWVLYITLSADGDCVIAIVPLDNDDWRRHGEFFDALRSEFSGYGFAVSDRCGDLNALMAQTYDDNAWFNGCCVPYSLTRCSGNGLMEE